ncbi:hypothetical protein CFP56_021631 [Quercus suber]|uniref:RNase H type-1 domain-containing protein n=1 Tax=Quercus suber TaxID=58331 RepID=A0AAW0KDE9_QUESU
MLFNSILNERRNSLQTFHEVKIQHCYREANKAADHLAKAAINPPPLSYVSPPNNVSTILSLTILLLVLPPTEFRLTLLSNACALSFKPKKKKIIIIKIKIKLAKTNLQKQPLILTTRRIQFWLQNTPRKASKFNFNIDKAKFI